MRLALGATRGAVLGQVLAESGRLIVAGLAVGLAASLAAGRLVASRLHGVAAHDALTIASAVVVLIAVAGLAATIPARRAASVDPIVTLRAE